MAKTGIHMLIWGEDTLVPTRRYPASAALSLLDQRGIATRKWLWQFRKHPRKRTAMYPLRAIEEDDRGN